LIIGFVASASVIFGSTGTNGYCSVRDLIYYYFFGDLVYYIYYFCAIGVTGCYLITGYYLITTVGVVWTIGGF
jgi:hypothetical protein